MKINIKSLKFDADGKLLSYVEKKVIKLEKFFDNVSDADVTLALLNEPLNKQARIQLRVPGQDLVVERNASTFEDAVTQCVDAMKERIVRNKEKKLYLIK